jgi:hypothetical protein
MGETINAYKILIGKSERKKPFLRMGGRIILKNLNK